MVFLLVYFRLFFPPHGLYRVDKSSHFHDIILLSVFVYSKPFTFSVISQKIKKHFSSIFSYSIEKREHDERFLTFNLFPPLFHRIMSLILLPLHTPTFTSATNSICTWCDILSESIEEIGNWIFTYKSVETTWNIEWEDKLLCESSKASFLLILSSHLTWLNVCRCAQHHLLLWTELTRCKASTKRWTVRNDSQMNFISFSPWLSNLYFFFKKQKIKIWIILFLSYRLELMRQFYNTAESPEMTIFNFNDKPAAVGGVESSTMSSCTMLTPTLKANATAANNDTSNGPNSCKNTSRLSLANLLPSRLDLRIYL